MSPEDRFNWHSKKPNPNNTQAQSLFKAESGFAGETKTTALHDDFHFETLEKNHRYASLIHTLSVQILVFTLIILLDYYLDNLSLNTNENELFFWLLFVASLTWILHSWFWVSVGGYVLHQNNMLYHSGIIWPSEVVLQFNQISRISLSQGFIESMFGLGRIRIRTTGKNSLIHIPLIYDAYSVQIKGIKYETALKIQKLASA